jgi:hypothetical protein
LTLHYKSITLATVKGAGVALQWKGMRMAKFGKTVDIWALSSEERAKLQPGQRVMAGENGPRGRFYGEGRSTVVAWDGNARGRWAAYQRAVSDYAVAVRKSAERGL